MTVIIVIVIVIVITIITKITMAIRIAIIIIIIIIIIISVYKASISLTVLGTLQYHKKCYSIKTTSISKKIRYKSINQVW